MPFYGDIFQANFYDLKNSKNRQNNGDLEPVKDFGPALVAQCVKGLLPR